MPPRVVLHVGPHKTGTTYLQRCLTEARPELRSQGIYFPTEFISPADNHLPLYHAARRAKRDPGEARALLDQIVKAGYDTIILSCEHFIYLDEEGLARLRDLIGVDHVDVVYYVRRWCSRLPSLWAQSLNVGHAPTLPEFICQLAMGTQDERVDYLISFDKLASVFGREHLFIVPYSSLMDQKIDLFEHFCRQVLRMAKPPDVSLKGKKAWASLDREDAEMIRLLNDVHLVRQGRNVGEVRNAYNRIARSPDVRSLKKIMEASVTSFVIDDRSSMFDAPYAAMSAYNDRLTKPDGDGMFVRRATNYSCVRPSYLVADGVPEKVDAIYAAMKSKLRMKTKASRTDDADSVEA